MSEPTPPERARVLIVDDQVENLVALETILEDLGVDTVRGHSGEEALRLMLSDDFAVVLLDVRMPGMDGFETAGFIRARPRSRHVPIIFVTAFDDPLERVTKGYTIGAVDYILKPINPDILRSKVKVFVELFLKTKSLEREIAERRRVEEELRASNKELEAFTYSVSHDLRGPLRAITGFSDVLLKDYIDLIKDEEGRDFLRRIAAGARQMDSLIQDLLAFSRLGREKIAIGPVDLSKTIDEALAQVDAGNAQIEKQDGLPLSVGNRTLLAQVFSNLVSNAVKFVAPEVKPRVKIRADLNGERVRVWVEDNGIGIAPEYHERIFRVFERLNPGNGYPGTGIGLAIVRRAMERMGGRCGVESSPGKGSRFWIELPKDKRASITV
jgi:two-component system sensor histidine kinase/response regulator